MLGSDTETAVVLIVVVVFQQDHHNKSCRCVHQNAEDVIAQQAKVDQDDPYANLSKKEKKKKKKQVIMDDGSLGFTPYR